ncbi:MAG: WD40 repeat domain-containing protein [Candidatus Babeliales bacterium]
MHIFCIILYCTVSFITDAQEFDQQSTPTKRLFRWNSNDIAEEISPRFIKLSPVLTNILEDISNDEQKPIIEFSITPETNKKLKSLYNALENEDEYTLQKKIKKYSKSVTAELFNIGEQYEIPLLATCALHEYTHYLKTSDHLKKFVATYKSSETMSYNPYAINNAERVRVALNSIQKQYGDPEDVGNHTIDDLIMDDFDMNGCDFINNNTFIFSNSRNNYKQFDIPTKTISSIGDYWIASNNTIIFTTDNGCKIKHKNKTTDIDGASPIMPSGMSKDGSLVLLRTKEQCMILDCVKNSTIPLENSNFAHVCLVASIFPAASNKSNCFSSCNTYAMVVNTAQLAVCRTIHIYNTKTGKLVHQLSVDPLTTPNVSFTHDESTLVYGDHAKNKICVYNMQTAQTVPLATHRNILRYLLHPHKNHLFVTTKADLQIWDIATNSLLHTIQTSSPFHPWDISPNGNYLFAKQEPDLLHCYDINGAPKKIWQYKVAGTSLNGSFQPFVDSVHDTVQLFKFREMAPTDSNFPNDPNCSHEFHLTMENGIIDSNCTVTLDMHTGMPINKPFAHLKQLRIATLATSPDGSKAIIGNLQCHNGTHPEIVTMLNCNQWSLPQALTIALLLHNKNNPANRIKFAHNPAIKELFSSLPESIQNLHTPE